MEANNTFQLTSDKPKKEFSLQSSISHIELIEIQLSHLMDNSNWHQELLKNTLRLKVELSCIHAGPTAEAEYLIDTWMKNSREPNSRFDDGIEIPNFKLRLPMKGSNVSHYDKMIFTLIQSDKSLPVSVKFIYKNHLETPFFSVRCYDCGNRNDFPDSDIDWEVEEVSERQMGIETMFSGEFESNCNYCDYPLSVQFYYWEYPTNILNYHEEKAENCMVVKNPNFIERHFEEAD